MQHETLDPQTALEGLTDKQREVLDLLIEHKTSKEIARNLRISPHTVDQRIQFAKDKLGARTRGEAAVTYRRLIEIYGQSIYDDSGIAEFARALDEGAGTQGPLPSALQRIGSLSEPPTGGAEADFPVVPELFDGRYGTLVRLVVIIAMAVLLAILVLGGLAIYSQLSQLMAG